MPSEKVMHALRTQQILNDEYGVEKLEMYIKGFCSDHYNPKPETARALGFARVLHDNQKRDDGRLYIHHPFFMACLGICLGLTEDELIAITLLHDVCEDTNCDVDDLPFNDSVREGVRRLTFKPQEGQDKLDAKIEYYNQLTYSSYAFPVKGLDRIYNLCTAVGAISKQRVIKNILGTHQIFLPRFQLAQEYFPEYTNPLFVLESFTRALNNVHAIYNGIDLTQYPPIL